MSHLELVKNATTLDENLQLQPMNEYMLATQWLYTLCRVNPQFLEANRDRLEWCRNLLEKLED